MADDKLPLAASVNGEAVDYEALFNREGDHRRHSEKFATKTAIGEVHIHCTYSATCIKFVQTAAF
jgi:hypothetical protein